MTTVHLLMGEGLFLRVYRSTKCVGDFLRRRDGWLCGRADYRSDRYGYGFDYAPHHHYGEHITAQEAEMLAKLEGKALLTSGMFEISDAAKQGGYVEAWFNLPYSESGAIEMQVAQARLAEQNSGKGEVTNNE